MDVPVRVVTSNLNAQLLQLSDEVAAVKTLISKKMCCFKCGKEGHYARNCGSGRKSAIVCYKCGKRGHFSATCSKKLGVTGHIFQLTSNSSFCTSVLVNNAQISALVDTGASVSCLSSGYANEAVGMNLGMHKSLVGADESLMKVRGTKVMQFELQNRMFKHNLSYDIILGLEFLSTSKAQLDCKHRTISFPSIVAMETLSLPVAPIAPVVTMEEKSIEISSEPWK